jgi:hypothetical protein
MGAVAPGELILPTSRIKRHDSFNWSQPQPKPLANQGNPWHSLRMGNKNAPRPEKKKPKKQKT